MKWIPVRKILTVSLAVLLPGLYSFGQGKKAFPAFIYKTIKGEVFTNENLYGTNKVVIHFHLGCPAAMLLLSDLQKMNLDSHQLSNIVCILENTNDQILAFNDTAKSVWSATRAHFRMQPLSFITIGECDKEVETQKQENGHYVIPKQCSHLGEKLNIKVSPVIFYLNSKSEIIKKGKGYSAKRTLKQVLGHIGMKSS